MNNFKSKKVIASVVLAVVLVIFIGAVYFANAKIRSYKTEVLDDYNKLAELESEKTILTTYNKILSQGSDESVKVKKYILSSDRKEVLGLINQLEEYAKRSGLTENNNSPIASVATRENALIKDSNASDLVITINLVGDENKIEGFVNLLNTLPLISYIEKIDMKFDAVTRKNNASIILIMYQKNEVK